MRELVEGLGYVAKGQRWVVRHRRWWGFGLLPGVITLVLYAAALVALVWWSGDLAGWLTPFADGWASGWRETLRVLLTAALIGGGLLLSVVTFTAVTLLVGDPFYESLSEQVEDAEGGAPQAPERPLSAEIALAVRETVAILLRVAGFGLVLFVLGFLPVVGQTAVPVAGACVSGFFLTEELTAVALGRRDLRVAQRLRLLRGHLPLAVGFGVPLSLLFLIPFAAVFLMPGAVAGATLLARRLAPAPDGDEPDGPPFASGRDADVYALPDGSVLRRYRETAGPVDAAREAAFMAHAGGHGFPVPAVRRANGTDLVMERLHGPTLLEAYRRGTVEVAQAAVIMADLHRRLHLLPPPEPAAPAAAPGRPDTRVPPQAGARPLPGDRLLHLDLHPANIVLTPAGPVLIDWRNARVGPPGLDLAVSALILAQVTVEPGNPLAAAARQLLAAFAAAAPGDPTACLEQAATVRAGHRTTPEAERRRLPEAVALARALAAPRPAG